MCRWLKLCPIHEKPKDFPIVAAFGRTKRPLSREINECTKSSNSAGTFPQLFVASIDADADEELRHTECAC